MHYVGQLLRLYRDARSAKHKKILILDVYKWKLDTPDKLMDRILVVAVCIKKREDQPIRTTSDLRTRVAKCTEVDGWDFRIFTVNCNIICHLSLTRFLFKH